MYDLSRVEICPLGSGTDLSEGEYQSAYSDPPDLKEAPQAPRALRSLAGEWRTSYGFVLRIVDMSSAHLKNAIAFFECEGWGDHAKLVELRAELSAR